MAILFFISVSNEDGTPGPIHVKQAPTIELHLQTASIELMAVLKKKKMDGKNQATPGSGNTGRVCGLCP